MPDLIVSIRYRGRTATRGHCADILRQATWEAARQVARETGCADDVGLVGDHQENEREIPAGSSG